MTQNNSNPRQMPFPSVVALDVWAKPVPKKAGIYSLHVDVTFGEGREGGELESQVEFRLEVAAAAIWVGDGSSMDAPVIDSDHVRREFGTSPAIRRTTKLGSVDATKARGKAGVGIKNLKPNASIAIDAGVERNRTTKVETTITEKPRLIEVKHSPSAVQGVHVFNVKASQDDTLSGKPWDPKSEPLARVGRRSGGPIAEVLAVSVRVKWDDLVISDVEPKDQSLKARMSRLGQNQRIAAQQYIKHQIAKLGMPTGDPGSKFSEIVFANVRVEI